MYLWNNFLGGDSPDRPLGDARLDGIDFDIEGGNGAPFYRDLAGRLHELGPNKDKYYYLTAAPQCPYPDAWLGDAISTSLFDYVWIQFYDNPQCEYVGNPEGFKNMWNQWVTRSHAAKFFVGLPASHAAADASAYIPVDVLNNQVVPFLLGYGFKYGGVMLWNRYEDKSYSSRIRVLSTVECLISEKAAASEFGYVVTRVWLCVAGM